TGSHGIGICIQTKIKQDSGSARITTEERALKSCPGSPTLPLEPVNSFIKTSGTSAMSAPSLLHPPHTGQIRKLFFGISASLVILLSASCAGVEGTSTETVSLVDPDATAETRALFVNLRMLAPDHVLFGHQDDLAYGVTWKREDGRSDVKETAGSFPAVYGWEIGDFENDVE